VALAALSAGLGGGGTASEVRADAGTSGDEGDTCGTEFESALTGDRGFFNFKTSLKTSFRNAVASTLYNPYISYKTN